MPNASPPHRSAAQVAAIVLGVLVAAVALAFVAVLVLAAHPELPERAAGPIAFDAATVQRGAGLAAVGNCAACHSATFGAPYAGGVALPTPFGTIHGTNITPDPETGIGRWSEAAFVRAMREGVDRAGRQLYPAFPYDHFTHTSDDDLHALYAFVMTRDPVHAPNVANALRFPFGFRPLVAGWNLLFLHRGPDAGVDAAGGDAPTRRGAYLVGSLGHCGGCHTARNALGAERRDDDLGGGEAEGWYAPALNERSPSPLPWTVDELTAYLRTGIAGDHAVAGGPMQGVVESLARAPLEDVRAIATYIASRLAPAAAAQQARARAARERVARAPLGASAVDVGAAVQPTRSADASGSDARHAAGAQADPATLQLGATVYAGACASCHDRGRELSSNGALQLPLAIAVHDPDPRSLLRIVRGGIAPPPAQAGRFMPAFGTSLDDAQLVALLTFLRTTAADAPPWPDLPEQVRASKATP